MLRITLVTLLAITATAVMKPNKAPKSKARFLATGESMEVLSASQGMEISGNAVSSMAKQYQAIFEKGAMAEVRNRATRMFFHNVFHLPTIDMKQAAVTQFLEKAEKEIGQPLERMSNSEIETWLQSEFLAEDLVGSGMGLAFLMNPQMQPEGLKSRGQDFRQKFTKQLSCGPPLLEKFFTEKFSLNYGTSCGLQDKQTGCDEKKDVQIGDESRTVCKDGGLDTCCSQHDLTAAENEAGPNMHFMLCKADLDLVQCANAVQPSSFIDGHGVSEQSAKEAITCLYKTMPCLARTNNKRVFVDWGSKERVSVFAPNLDDREHYQVVFPFDQAADSVAAEEVYRSSTVWPQKVWTKLLN